MELNELESLVSQLKSVLNQAESVLGKTSNQPLSKPNDNEKKKLYYRNWFMESKT